MNRNQTGWLSLILLVIMVAAPLKWTALQAWPIVAACMIGFILLLGVTVSQRPLGVLINEQNLMSLSRLQTILWTLIIVSAYFVIAVARVRIRPSVDPLDIKIDSQVLALLGISAASLVGNPLINAVKKAKKPDGSAASATAKEMLSTNNTPDSLKTTPPPAGNVGVAGAAPANPQQEMQEAITENAQGILYKNPSIKDASFSDIFEGDEIGNTAHVDLAKVQMFFFTLIVALAYIAALYKIMHKDGISASEFNFPNLSEGMVGLLGISNASYLTNQSVDHTKKSE